jgi:hypothetical protein
MMNFKQNYADNQSLNGKQQTQGCHPLLRSSDQTGYKRVDTAINELLVSGAS